MKKLYKNEHDEVLTGVIGGIGEYFSVDPTVLRIIFVILVLVTGVFPGIIAYIIAYFLIPEKPHGVSTLVTPLPMKTPEPIVEASKAPEPITAEKSKVIAEDLMKVPTPETTENTPEGTKTTPLT